MPFKFITAALIISICLLISSSSSANHITSPLLVLSTLKTSNNLDSGSVLICSSFTNCLLIPMWVHSESISALSYSSFLFDVFTFVCTLSSFSLLFLLWRITMYKDSLYCAYSKPLTKFASLSLSSLSLYTLLFFIFCFDLQFFIRYPTWLYL